MIKWLIAFLLIPALSWSATWTGYITNDSDDCNVYYTPSDHGISVVATANPDYGFIGSDEGAGVNGGSVDTYDSCGFRWRNVTIPQGSTINSVTVTFTGFSSPNSGSPSVTIKGQLAANGVAFSTESDYTGRTRTSASVSWSPSTWTEDATTNAVTPSLVTVLQEIVNQGGWASGNALVFFIEYTSGSAGAFRKPYMYSALSTTKCAFISIDYTAPAGGSAGGSGTIRQTQRTTQR